MTVTIGSKWIHKVSPNLHATVVSTMKWRGQKYIIYSRRAKHGKAVLDIETVSYFVDHYRHPDTVGDVP
jgi:hypothetical protein